MTTAAHTTSAVSVPSFDLATTVAAWDALTPAEMRRRGSLKWSQPGETIGAWVAEMDLGTAPSVSAVLRRAVDTGTLGYMPASLAQQAREATARYESEVLGWQVPVEHISLLPNVLSALGAIIEYHTRPGSAVIVPTPAYMPFLSIPGQHGRECIQVPALRTPASAASGTPGWALDLEPIESAMAAGAGLLVLCNPWNPVGRVLDPAELDAVAALSTRYGVPVFSDEIHAPLIVDPAARHVPYASRKGADPDLTFTATAASKGWNVPGLHCAQLIASGQARQTWQSHPLSAALGHEAAALGAAAAVAAFDEGRQWNQAARSYIHANASLAAQRLSAVEGVEITVPAGSYLAWVDFSGLPLPEGESPAAFFTREAGVVMNDGAAFGLGYESYCRLNLATGRAIEEETLTRIVDAVGRL
ncbi:MAG: aminotransferase class I/II-fold pyridoxal phosphate-dependent enzyme [Actinomyces urogenitalis]|uniref:MalY/PatB family protein n=1 Tax=Actinomyces urogenitalis TaxID=103621 RepID=UPI00290E8EDD|nr:aminotransferase class I/II-fold pyridoxal phosphate-dependent enzyme [Actinomyces urogenitalis]MDU6150667.1 aminotransferase class I/II-fold pyridoxal phosphate-dependent enzyme [Actinomyces urogenitalis]